MSILDDFRVYYLLRPEHGRAQALRGSHPFNPSAIFLRSHGPVYVRIHTFEFLYAVSLAFLGIPAGAEDDGFLSAEVRCSGMQGSSRRRHRQDLRGIGVLPFGFCTSTSCFLLRKIVLSQKKVRQDEAFPLNSANSLYDSFTYTKSP